VTLRLLVQGVRNFRLGSLAHDQGLDVHTFGEPMVFWQRNMPKGMLLRSGWEASHIADPNQSLTLDVFRRKAGITFPAQCRSTVS